MLTPMDAKRPLATPADAARVSARTKLTKAEYAKLQCYAESHVQTISQVLRKLVQSLPDDCVDERS